MVEKLAPGLLMEEVCQGVHHSVCHLFACAARATALCSTRGAKSGLEHVEKHASVGVVNTMEVLQHSRASGPRFLVRTSAELLPDLIKTHQHRGGLFPLPWRPPQPPPPPQRCGLRRR